MSNHAPPVPPRPIPKGMVCPYCGAALTGDRRCQHCGGLLDPLSRQATQNVLGPWFVRDPHRPFRPGCSFEMLRRLVARGEISPTTIIRGPTTRQFWIPAVRTPTVANLLGSCHNCGRDVEPTAPSCPSCGSSFAPAVDRQHLGLGPVRLLPGQAPPDVVAASSSDRPPGSGAASSEDRTPSGPAACPTDGPARSDTARLERRVRSLRRWNTVLALLCVVVLVAAAGMGVAPKLGVSLGVVDGFLGRPTRAESSREPGTNSRSPFIRDERCEQTPGQPAPDERVLRGEPGSEEEANLPENPSDQEPPPSEPEGGPDQVGSAEPQPAAVGVARRYVEIRELIATGDADAIGRALEDLAAMAPGAARHAEFAELRRIAEDRREQLRLRGSL